VFILTDTQNNKLTAHALLALSYFEKRTRENGDKYLCLKDDKPEWVYKLVYAAHYDGYSYQLPNDYRYEFIYDALTIISENEDHDDQYEAIWNSIDENTYDLTGWLHSRNDRYSYCEEAMKDYSNQSEFMQILRDGQFKERNEVYQSVLESLEDYIDTLEDNNDS
jgi:hypothetical protein